MKIHTPLIFLFSLFLGLCAFSHTYAAADFQLRENLKKAQPGDYLVTAQSKNYTVLVVRSKDDNYLSIDEITVPSAKIPTSSFSWRNWLEKGAAGNSCWLVYHIHLPTGAIQQTFSVSRNEWVTVPQSQNFLSTLLNLQLTPILEKERKKVGPPPSSDSSDRRQIWQPKLVANGQTISGVVFDAWKTHWPKDGGELSGRAIEIYLPQDSNKYPAYFPYWLQISGMIGKAKVRIVDSGRNLTPWDLSQK